MEDWADSASVSALFSVVSFSLSLDCCVSVGVEAEVEAASFALVCAVVVLGDDSTSVLPQPWPPVTNVTRPAVMAMATSASTTETTIAQR